MSVLSDHAALGGPVAPCTPLPAPAQICCAADAQACPAPSTWAPPALDLAALLAAPDSAAAVLAATIRAAPDGVLVLNNALRAPFGAIGELFDRVSSETGARANKAYRAGSSRLVWKDARGESRGGPHVDFKRVIDLSPHRMECLSEADPELASELGEPLNEALSFFTAARGTYGPLLVAALRQATGYPFTQEEARFALRLVDYGQREIKADAATALPPRCGEHRDFGPATLIWGSCQGLEVRVGETWRRLPHLYSGSAVLLFGICTAWRSNDRLQAAQHRVADEPALLAGAAGGGVSPRRLSAVMFMGLQDSALLEPALLAPGEAPRWRTVSVGEVQPTVRRKWSWREGSVTAEEAAAEEAEWAQYRSQEELLAAKYRIDAAPQ